MSEKRASGPNPHQITVISLDLPNALPCLSFSSCFTGGFKQDLEHGWGGRAPLSTEQKLRHRETTSLELFLWGPREGSQVFQSCAPVTCAGIV